MPLSESLTKHFQQDGGHLLFGKIVAFHNGGVVGCLIFRIDHPVIYFEIWGHLEGIWYGVSSRLFLVRLFHKLVGVSFW